jgi:hypothetical protein
MIVNVKKKPSSEMCNSEIDGILIVVDILRMNGKILPY